MIHLLSLIRAAAEGRGTGIDIDGLEVAFADDGDSLTLAIGPTDSFPDLSRSLSWSPVEFAGGHAHAGYCAAGRKVASSPILRAHAKGRSVHLAGHSLGAATAEALALWWHLEQFCEVLSVTTFGGPAWLRPGFPWPPTINRRRVVCGHDPIPMWCPGYTHHHPANHLPSIWGPFLAPLDHRLSSYERAVIENVNEL